MSDFLSMASAWSGRSELPEITLCVSLEIPQPRPYLIPTASRHYQETVVSTSVLIRGVARTRPAGGDWSLFQSCSIPTDTTPEPGDSAAPTLDLPRASDV